MPLLATNYDGVLPMMLLGMAISALVMAGPFFVYYPIMVSVSRGWRRSSTAALLTAVFFVILAPITGIAGLWLGGLSGGTALPYGALALTMGLLPSIALGVALQVDTQSFFAAGTPAAATLLLAALLGSLPPDLTPGAALLGLIAWHLALGLILRLDAVPRWRIQAMPKGHCLACGYNRTGLPPGPCPECGVDFPAKKA